MPWTQKAAGWLLAAVLVYSVLNGFVLRLPPELGAVLVGIWLGALLVRRFEGREFRHRLESPKERGRD